MRTQYQSLTAFAEEIESRENRKEDYLMPTSLIRMTDPNTLFSPDSGDLGITDYAHGQIASTYKIPKNYYDMMEGVPGLREYNVNAWFKEQPMTRFVRTLDGRARAFLSDRYRPMDNYLVMQSFLPVLQQYPEAQIRSSNLSDTRLYLQVSFPELSAEIRIDDVVEYGIILTNSEVGAGAVDIAVILWFLKCLNGMRMQSLFRKHHVGKRIDTENMESYDIFQADTIEAEVNSLRLRLRDTIADAITESNFQAEIAKIKRANQDKIERPQDVIQKVTKRYNLSDKEGDMILANMIDDMNITRYGVANGITHLAHSIENPDRAYEIEKLGGQIIELSPTDWAILAA